MSDEPTMTRAEWERHRAAEHAQKDTLTLASKVAELEYDLRSKRDELKALTAKLPPEGAVVLSRADAERWSAYTALGKPDELSAALSERDALKADLSKRDRTEQLRAAAQAAGYKPSVLERLAPDGAAFSVREVTGEDGQVTQVAYLKTPEGQEQPLTEWAQANAADFLPALSAQPVTNAVPAPAAGPQFVQQRPTTAPTTVIVGDRAAELRASGVGTI